MDMDDEHSTSDDHGIFSALTETTIDGDELMDKSVDSTTEEMHEIVEIVASHDEHDEHGEDGGTDDNVKVLTTLESSRQSDEPVYAILEFDDATDEQDVGIEVLPIHGDDDDSAPGEDDDLAAAVEASRVDSTEAEVATVDLNESDRARRQLQLLDNRKRSKRSASKSAATSPAANGQAHATKSYADGPQIIKMEIIKPSAAVTASNQQLIKTMQNRLSQKLDQCNYQTPHKPIPKQEYAGTIEIPKDLIIAASDDDLDGTSFVISTVSTTGDADDDAGAADPNDVADADLLAILEGNDDNNDESVVTSPPQPPQPIVRDRDSEMELAMQQIMSLPTKRKGRPKKNPDPVVRPTPVIATVRQTKAKDLVHSIVQDWSGSESDSSATPVVQNKKGPAPAKKAVKPAPVEVPARRSRIIKKKVIWDPDAPETAISYASLVQPTAAPAAEAATAAVAKKPINPPRILNAAAASASRSPPLQAIKRARAQVSTPPSPQRKRKVSEVDRLMRDEGASNMLNALKRESAEREEFNEAQAAGPVDESTTPPTTKSPTISASVPAQQRSVRIKRPHADTTNNATAAAPAAAAAKPQRDSVAKRPKKATAAAAASDANSWDYIYSHRGDDALIIRRRSNSSYSSSASNSNRLSIDTPTQPSPAAAAPKTSATAKSKTSRIKENVPAAAAVASAASFEFAKPSARRSAAASDSNADSTTILMDIRSKATAAAAGASASAHETRRSKRAGIAAATPGDDNNAAEQQLNAKERKIVAKLSTTGVVTTVVKADKSPPAKAAAATAARNSHQFQEIDVVWRTGNAEGVVQIVLLPFSGRLENVFTVQLMREVSKALHQLATDATCKVVAFTSATATFCNGLDYSSLLQPTAEKRRLAAEDLAADVR